MEEKADLLAMGTAAGTVLIYSTAKGALHCTLVSGGQTHTASPSKITAFQYLSVQRVYWCLMEWIVEHFYCCGFCQDGGHSGGVNCVEWHPEDGLLYSGSDDTNIVEWDLQTGKTRRLVFSFIP